MKNISVILIEKTMTVSALFGIAFGMIGGQWDSWSHVKQGHILLAPPHLVIIFGFGLFVFSSFLSFLLLKRRGDDLPAWKKRSLKLTMGGLLVPPSLGLDEAWHALFGLDQTFWSLPHAFLFASVASVLLGLGFYFSQGKKPDNSMWLTKRHMLSVLFFSTVLLLGIFSLGDFEHPHMASIAGVRPGFTYPITVTGISVLMFLVVALSLRSIGAVTIAAALAWSYHAATAFLIALIGGFWHTALPFPIFFPAVIIDVWLFLALRKIVPRTQFTATMVVASVSYWGAIAWALFYTKLPQQISGDFGQWLLVWLAVLVGSLILRIAANHTVRYFVKNPA